MIRLFGSPRLEDLDGGHVSFRTSKVPSLMGYLVARGGRPVSRTEVAEALWPNREPALAHQNLRQTLLYLRASLGPAGETKLLASRRDLRLRPESDECDVEAFGAALARRPPDLERAVALYSGPFLEGIEGDWVHPVRAEFAHAFTKALLDLSDRLLDGDPARALSYAERAVAEEPFHDGARARKIRALCRLGEETLALKEFEAYETLLDEELGLRPATIVEEALADGRTRPSPAKRLEPTAPVADIGEALRVLAAGERPQDAVRLAVSLVPYWLEMGTPGAGLRQLDLARQGAPTPPRPLKFAAALAAADLTLRTGEFERGIHEASAALALAEGHQERYDALLLLAQTSVFRRTTDGRAFALRALRIARAHGLPTGAAWLCVGAAQDQDDRSARVLASCRRAQANAEGSKRVFARAGILMGTALETLGRKEEAQAAVEEALAALEHDRSFETTGARITASRRFESFGELDRAERGYEEGIDAYRRRGDAYGLGVALTYLADLKTRRGDSAAAIRMHTEAIGLREASGDVLGLATSVRGVGVAHFRANDLEAARKALREAVRLYADVDWTAGIASCLVPLARAEAAVGSREVARRLALRAVRLLRGMRPETRHSIGPEGGQALLDAEELLIELSSS